MSQSSDPEDHGLLASLRSASRRAEQLTRENEELRKQVKKSSAAATAHRVPEEGIRQKGRRVLQEGYKKSQRENAELANRLVRVESENGQLVSLYVANSQLHSTLELESVLGNIVEIIINLVGAEKFAVYMFDEQTRAFAPVAAEGAEPSEFPSLSVDDEALAGALASREQRFSGADSKDGSQPIAWIPLRMGDQPVGAIAIYRLLVQKDGFSPVDHQLFALMAESAASALFAAKLYSDSERKGQVFRGFLDLLTN